MANRHYDDHLLTPPLPSATVPVWAVVLLLLSYIAGCRYFFGNPDHLLGGPPPKNEYISTLRQPAPTPVIIRLAPPVLAPPTLVTPLPAATSLVPTAAPLPTHAPHSALLHPPAVAHHHQLHPGHVLTPAAKPKGTHIHHPAYVPPAG